MNPILTYVNRPTADALQYFFWRHPEWWTRVIIGLAWAVMLLHGWQHLGHEVHHRMTFPHELAYWMLMVAAMMLPLVIGRVWVTAAGSLWSRRHRAIAGFLCGYFAPWLILGIAFAGLRQASWTHTYLAPALCFGVAAVWQRTPVHRRALLACHRNSTLAPVGWPADRDCLHFGGTIGVTCVWSCWPLMLACAFAGHSLIAMSAGMAIGAAERWSARPLDSPILAATLALGTCYLALALISH